MVKAFKSDVAASKHQNIHDFTAEVELEVEHNEDEEEEEEEEELGDDRDKEVADFDSHEARHGSVFRQQGLQRLSCFSHTLQLVVSSFNKDSASKELLSTAYKVVQQVSQSGKVTEALISAAGKKLVSRSVTRWTSAYLVIDRLLEVKEPLKIVLLNHNLTMLQPQDWEVLKNVRTLLYKFANYTNVVGGEQYTTLSLVIPYYIELQHHLEDMMKIDKLQSVSKIMALELERRFSNLLDPAHENHNSLYMVATLLDPRFKNLLEKEHIAYARKECIKLLCNGDYESDSENAASSSQPVPSVLEASESDDEPANKRFRYVFDIMDKKATEKKEVAKRQPNLPELQLDCYIHTTARTRYDPDSDPILFWIQSRESYTFLAPFAIDILAAPSSSAPVERTFSTAGIATSGRRNRLAKDNLEKEVLLKKNEEYYMKIYLSDKTSV